MDYNFNTPFVKVIYPKYDENNNRNELSISQISNLIDRKKSSNDFLDVLNDYYLGKNKILSYNNCNAYERKLEIDKPNNRISHPYAYTITNMITGYLIGQPVRYILPDEAYQVIFNKIMEYNDAKSVDTTNAMNQSKYGFGVEQLYLDENADIRFNSISPYNTIFICDNTIDEDLWCVVKFNEFDSLEDQTKTLSVEVYYDDKVVRYSNNYTKVEEDINPFKDVPFILYQNNDDFMGDYVRVISLIDAYDKVISDITNDIEYNSDAFLKVTGVTIDTEEAAKMKKLKVFNLPDQNADISYVTKNVDNSANEYLIENLNADIHKFSLTPDLNSEAFLASNASGTALRLKFQGLEFLCSNKESYLEKGLKRRVELVNNILNLKSSKDIDLVSDTKIVFTRNTVDNISELISQVNELSSIISKEGQIEMLDGIIDSEKELERLEENSNLPFITETPTSTNSENDESLVPENSTDDKDQ